ncbi:MAG: dihydrodipicolinate synthase family protein [Hamadaea sp.]|uniref:dihydrodipicolinate synthase family protein n=1 Tax=Hamadaea sp. TaxID=2024425 RepID=UPI00181E2D5E|nr:dihydrodipicolinate synthase family protein [Hamadaea sp.]NUR72568.1 dihydrodipicolinate synthase family protein [Hamadaea sp.]NUT24298.1 dihydrodipicolinate synthase family protein [Hamadaea sp.]
MINRKAAELRDRLRGQLIAATATPTGPDGVNPEVLANYLRGLVTDGVGALAVLAHTGRGPFQSDSVREQVIRAAVDTGVPVVAGVQGVREAQRAAEAGADALLVFPPAPGEAVAVHQALWEASELPLIAFDLYLRPYPLPVVRDLVELPGVAGLKVALLRDDAACKDAFAATNEADRLAITGEDLMFAPSIAWGAQAALVGIAAAAVQATDRVLQAALAGEAQDTAPFDRYAETIFGDPVDGYVQRMLWVAAAEGRIPPEYAVDPHGPALPDGEHERVLEVLRAL